MANPRARGQTPRRKSAAGKRSQIRSVQRSNKGEDRCGDIAKFSASGAATAGSIATGDAAAINPTCTGATICAEDSAMAGIGALRWQQGATGAEAGTRWLFMALWVMPQCIQPAIPAGAAETQTASPRTGARSTVTSNQEAMSPRECIYHLYTRSQQRGSHNRLSAGQKKALRFHAGLSFLRL